MNPPTAPDSGKAGPGTPELARRLLDGEPAALARSISLVESGSAAGLAILRAVHPALGTAARIGITGPPGAGKSTLVNALIHALRAGGHRVGVAAVDPSSPISGGSILGDRVRMGDHDLDEHVFIRSLASGGELGGLSVTATRVADLMDAAGFDRIILETVGTGQSEVDIADLADARVVVCAPGLGDEVQALKAGILEIADVLVVNKSDQPQAARLTRELRASLGLRHAHRGVIPVVETVATRSEGIDELLAAIDDRLRDLSGDAAERGRRRLRRMLARAAARQAERQVLDGGAHVDRLCDALHRGEVSLEEACRQMTGEPR